VSELSEKTGANRISVVTPTLRRPKEVAELMDNLSQQVVLPFELILVDGAPDEEKETEEVVGARRDSLPYTCRYIRHSGGTAIQRNVGIDAATGDFVAFIDDDIRLEPDFCAAILRAFRQDSEETVGGIVGFRSNQQFAQDKSQRWRWYRRLRLLSTYEPGRYDFRCGYPINACAQPPFEGTREVDFMTTSCGVWRREVLADGLRFDEFFRDYGVLEDAHFSLRAGKRWQLQQCGDARCAHLHSPGGRVSHRKVGYKCVVNYYYVFNDVAGPLTMGQKFRFWRYQCFELFRIATSAIRRGRLANLDELRGRLAGFAAVARGKWKKNP